MPTQYIRRILNAQVYDVAVETPLEPMHLLSKALMNDILVKREDLQPVFSFKIRGAYNKMSQLPMEQRAAGVIAASAGNHAQGVALAAQKLGLQATIVMPTTTPSIKVNSVRERGASVILQGDRFDEAAEHAARLAEERSLTVIHPYDDPDVIAGQGTIGMEILRQRSGRLDALFVPVGGGGLIAGISTFVKYLRPDVRIVGVESEDSACLQAALAAGRRVRLPRVGIFADGIAVAQIGKEPFRLAREYVDEVITVSDDEICGAIRDLFDDTRSIAEPAGATAIAGVRKYVAKHGSKGQVFLAVNSGANVNFSRLRYVSERTDLGEKKEILFAATIPERPGSLRAFCQVLGKHDITEFNYRYEGTSAARIFVGVRVAAPDTGEDLMADLASGGYGIVDMSHNELAKEHVCHMVGGHPKEGCSERLFRFEFPERPGALMNFLSHMGSTWNISLFHYRNQGGAYGRVCMALQVPDADSAGLARFLDELHYVYVDETDNPAYELFLK